MFQSEWNSFSLLCSFYYTWSVIGVCWGDWDGTTNRLFFRFMFTFSMNFYFSLFNSFMRDEEEKCRFSIFTWNFYSNPMCVPCSMNFVWQFKRTTPDLILRLSSGSTTDDLKDGFYQFLWINLIFLKQTIKKFQIN